MIAIPIAGGAVILAAAVVLAGHAGSPASVGAGVQVGPVRVTMAPGTTARARVQVQDTGSATETLTVLGGWETGDGPIAAFPWVRRASVTTAPGHWRTVVFTIAVPAGTTPGQYRRYVGATASPAANPGGAAFGADSFTDLVITVVPSATFRNATSRNDHTSTTRTGA